MSLTALRARLAEIADLDAAIRLAGWDQQVFMPADGAESRAHLLATLQGLRHERFASDELGEWLEAAEAEAGDELDRDVVRIARRDYDKQRQVPTALAAELARAAAEGQAAWLAAREAGDAAGFLPALRHNVELAREYAACFPEAAHPYDHLLDDYDPGLTTAAVQATFDRLREAIPPLVERGVARPAPDVGPPFPVEAQKAAVAALLHRLGVDEQGWRVDESAHPFTSWLGTADTRITTRYDEGDLHAVLAAVHEFGHGLYERAVDPALRRTNLGTGTSMSIHESQSKLWENHVGRSRGFAGLLAAALTDGGAGRVDPDGLSAYLRMVRRGVIRVNADEVTYPLHIVLRFELERALFDGALDPGDLPGAFADGLRELVGVEPANANEGVLQDIHWAAGAFGYFPSYALGCVIAAQLW
ncbi:MAG: carboxypeptidase M32 [Solirubrobacterales bacterium]|nr:carboxypeptidase M32 [Solirubrobacterales bacterium]